MPLPGYIFCSASGALDQFTSAVSAFNLIDAVSIRLRPEERGVPAAPAPLVIKVCAKWIREEADNRDAQFEAQLVGYFPGREEEMILALYDPFLFTPDGIKRQFADLTIPGFFGPGVFILESRIRRLGETEWLARQQYPILLTTQGEPEAEPPPNGTAPQ